MEIISFVWYHICLYLYKILFWGILVLLLGFFTYRAVRKKKNKKKALIITIFIAYIFCVFIATLFARNSQSDFRYKIQLFWSIRSVINGRINMLYDILLNILLFVPYGFLLLGILKKYFKEILFSGFLVSSIIEILQLVTRTGFFELDDIVFNTIGVIVGCLLFLLYKNIKRYKHGT